MSVAAQARQTDCRSGPSGGYERSLRRADGALASRTDDATPRGPEPTR